MPDNYVVLDGNGTPRTMRSTEAAGIHTARHHTESLPSAFTDDTTAIKTAVQALAAIIGSGRLLVTIQAAVETKLDSIVTALGSHLATLAGTVTSSRVAVNTDLNAVVGVCNQETVGVTQAALTSQACSQGAWVKNISAGAQIVYVYYGVATASNGYQLSIGEERFFPCRNVNELHAIASAASARVCWEAA